MQGWWNLRKPAIWKDYKVVNTAYFCLLWKEREKEGALGTEMFSQGAASETGCWFTGLKVLWEMDFAEQIQKKNNNPQAKQFKEQSKPTSAYDSCMV